MSELKPCPCCGSSNVILDCDSHMDISWSVDNVTVKCIDCEIRTETFWCANNLSEEKCDECIEEAYDCWNSRPNENKLKADAVREAAKEINWTALTKPQQAKDALVYLANKLEKGEL